MSMKGAGNSSWSRTSSVSAQHGMAKGAWCPCALLTQLNSESYPGSFPCTLWSPQAGAELPERGISFLTTLTSVATSMGLCCYSFPWNTTTNASQIPAMHCLMGMNGLALLYAPLPITLSHDLAGTRGEFCLRRQSGIFWSWQLPLYFFLMWALICWELNWLPQGHVEYM